jgi:hypothetical protein
LVKLLRAKAALIARQLKHDRSPVFAVYCCFLFLGRQKFYALQVIECGMIQELRTGGTNDSGGDSTTFGVDFCKHDDRPFDLVLTRYFGVEIIDRFLCESD